MGDCHNSYGNEQVWVQILDKAQQMIADFLSYKMMPDQ